MTVCGRLLLACKLGRNVVSVGSNICGFGIGLCSFICAGCPFRERPWSVRRCSGSILPDPAYLRNAGILQNVVHITTVRASYIEPIVVFLRGAVKGMVRIIHPYTQREA